MQKFWNMKLSFRKDQKVKNEGIRTCELNEVLKRSNTGSFLLKILNQVLPISLRFAVALFYQSSLLIQRA